MSEYAAQFKLRLSYELKKQLEIAAKEGARSLTAEILLRLERSFEPDMRLCMALRAELVAARALAQSAIDVMSRRCSELAIGDMTDATSLEDGTGEVLPEVFEQRTLEWLHVQHDATTRLLAELAYADAVGEPLPLDLMRTRIQELQIHLPQE